MQKIIIKGAREHNLKNIDLELPRAFSRDFHQPEIGFAQSAFHCWSGAEESFAGA